MPVCRLVTRNLLTETVRLDAEAITVIEDAFSALATRPVAMPPVLRLDILADDLKTHCGEVDVKTAHIPGLDTFALKISPGFFNNPAIGLPSLNGLMIVLSSRTGMLEAILLDNGYLTDIRTAAAGAVAARRLSRADSRRLAIIGTGRQARLQALGVSLVRSLDLVTVWGRNDGAAAACAHDIAEMTGIEARIAASVEDAVGSADIVVTTTAAQSPLVRADMLRPGMHLTAMGSDAEEKNELDPLILTKGALFCDSRSQCARLGELHHAIRSGALANDHPIAELGDVIAGNADGRRHASDVTVCDLTGTGVQDTAIAHFALDRIIPTGRAMLVDL